MNSRIVEFNPEAESLEQEALGAGEPSSQGKAIDALSEAHEMELAVSLLEVTNEAQFDRFLMNVARSAGAPAASKTHLLCELLKHVARKAIPFLIGNTIAPVWDMSHPSEPRAVGAGAEVFGLELEGLSSEDQEFESTKAFVRLAAAAARNLAANTAGDSPLVDASDSLHASAKMHAPGLLVDGVNYTARNRGNPPWPQLVGDVLLSSTRGNAPNSKELIMHDTDRTSLEFGQQESAFESGQFGEFGQGEWGGETEFGQGEWGGETEIIGEAEQVELAAELLNVSNEAELEQFLGALINKVGQLAGQAIRSPIGQALIPVLKTAAAKALPLAGAALGGYVGGPLGAQIGTGLANAAGQALGLEAESLSLEDREFEGAKQFVKLAAQTVQNAASAAPSGDLRNVAQQAMVTAAQKLAPALLGAGQQSSAPTTQGSPSGLGSQQPHRMGGLRHTGRWIRKGKVIVLLGV